MKPIRLQPFSPRLFLGGAALAQQTIAAAPDAKPQYGTFGFDEAGMDRSVAPGDNFYDFANGTWAKTTPIPADKSNYGAFNLLSDLSESRTKGILEAAASDPNSKIGVAYATFLDRPAIDAKGMAPIQPWLARIKSVDQGRLSGAARGGRRRAASAGRSAPMSGRTTRTPKSMCCGSARRASGCPTAIIICRPTPSWPRRRRRIRRISPRC